MTHFKELQRIELAIEHRDQTELDWAISYCKMRLQIAGKKEHLKYWRDLERKVLAAPSELQAELKDSASR
jgi:hypothetical protein